MNTGCVTFPKETFESYLSGLEQGQALLLQSWLKSRKQVNYRYHLDTNDLRVLYACFGIDFNHLSLDEQPTVVEGHEPIAEIAPMYMRKLLPKYFAENKWLKKWSRKFST